MGIQNIDHFDLIVSDVDRSVEFYRGLGVGIAERETGYGKLMKILLVGDHERINVTTPADSELQGRTVVAGGGHVCFAWEGTMDEVMEQLSRSGLTPRRPPREGAASVFLSDPDNNLVEILVSSGNDVPRESQKAEPVQQ